MAQHPERPHRGWGSAGGPQMQARSHVARKPTAGVEVYPRSTQGQGLPDTSSPGGIAWKRWEDVSQEQPDSAVTM